MNLAVTYDSNTILGQPVKHSLAERDLFNKIKTMKKLTILFLAAFLFSFQQNAFGQDSITLQDLEQFSYTFSIEADGFHGAGGEILSKAIADAHITMLGEDADSKLEHHFTNALISELDQNNYKNMVLETGGGSGKLINKMAKNGELTSQHIKALNQKYLVKKKDRTFVPILELRSVEAIQSMENANNRGWSFLSVGVEPWTSYKMLADDLYDNLLPKNKQTHQNLYEATTAFLDQQYEAIEAHNSDEVFKLISQIKTAKCFNDFLDKMAICEGNKATIKAIHESMEYWWMYGNKGFYEKNIWSAKQDKQKLAEDLKKKNFDFKKDKLFVKMYRNHLAKSMAIFGAFGVGNMLLELASYHGNESLSIGVVRRFYEADGAVKDLSQATDGFNKRYKELVQLGKKEEWVLVDLRPFVKAFYYGNYIQSDGLYKMFTRYDLLVIPKSDSKATANY